MVNGLPSLEAGKVLVLETTRFSVLGRPAGSSPPRSQTDWQSARGRAASRNGSRQRLAHDSKCGDRPGDRFDSGPERSQRRRHLSGDEFELEIPSSAVTLGELGERRARTSARNLWSARVTRVGREGRWGIRRIDLKVGAATLVAAITGSAIRDLGLERGSTVLAQVKATALRLRRPQVNGISGRTAERERPRRAR